MKRLVVMGKRNKGKWEKYEVSDDFGRWIGLPVQKMQEGHAKAYPNGPLYRGRALNEQYNARDDDALNHEYDVSRDGEGYVHCDDCRACEARKGDS